MRSAVLVILAFVVSALLAGALFWLTRAPSESPKTVLTFEIGEEKLRVAPGYVGAQARADGSAGPRFVAFLPDFKPAAGFDDIGPHTQLDERFQRLVFLAPRAADAKLDPSERTERLYERFLSPTSWSHPGGLVARAFEDGSPFEGDELFYAPPEGREFSARCRRPDPARKTPNTCMAVTRMGSLDVEIRFSASQLEDWRNILARARGFIESARR